MEPTDKIKLVKKIAVIAGAFTALISLLLFLNYMQIHGKEPLESKTLQLLVERLSTEPNNQELIGEIRHLDLLARRAYFGSIWQIKTGGYLLLFGAIVMVVALWNYQSLRFSIQPPSTAVANDSKNRQKIQWWIGISGAAIILLAGLSAYLTADHIRQFDAMQLAVSAPSNDDGIERIRIKSPDADITVIAETADEVIPAIMEEAEKMVEQVAKVPEQKAAKPAAVPLTLNSIQQNYNSFRGPWGNGISSHRNIPTDWDGRSGKNILWKIEIPIHGYNSPVIWGDKLFFSGASSSKRIVYCLDRHSGKILWEKEVSNSPGSPATPPRTTDDTGLAAPSLTVDDERVFAIFGTGDIIAFDLEGERIWAKNLGVPKNHYGHSSSLLTWDNKIFVQYDTQSGSKVLALDAATGRTIWETTRTNDISWASPLLVQVNGKMQLVLSANPDIAGYDIANGQQLWTVKAMSGEVGPSPAFGGGLVYAANEHATMVAIDPLSGKVVWEDRHYLPEVSSPVYHDGILYIATTFAVMASFEANSGKFLWEYDAEEQFYASPLVADGKLFFFDTNGKAYIFKPGKEPQLIGTPELGEKVYSTPAFADNRIYVRGNKHLYCIGLK